MRRICYRISCRFSDDVYEGEMEYPDDTPDEKISEDIKSIAFDRIDWSWNDIEASASDNTEEKITYIKRGEADEFSKIIWDLCNASYSIYSSIMFSTPYAYRYLEEWKESGDDPIAILTEAFVASALAQNVIMDRLTGNSIGWNNCSIEISAYGVGYTTSGGVTYGWEVFPEYDMQGDMNDPQNLCVYCYARSGGTLEKALLEHGFVKEEK